MNSQKPMTPTQRDRILKNLRAAIDAVQAIPVATPCTECDHYGTGHCDKWLADIPPEVMDIGCEEWVEVIPF